MSVAPHKPPRSRPLGWTGALLVALAVLCVYRGTSLLTGVTETRQHAYFDHLAAGFLDGRLYLENPPGQSDLTLHDDRWYVPFPPLVAGLMLPWIAAFGLTSMNSVWFSTLFGVLNVVLLARILDELAARHWITLSVGGRVWLLALFAFGYLHWQVAIEGSVWFLSHTCCVTFVALAVFLALKCERPWLPALALALAIWGRPTVIFTWPLLAGIVAQKFLDRATAADPCAGRDTPDDSYVRHGGRTLQSADRTLPRSFFRLLLTPLLFRWSALSAIPLLVSIAGMAWYNHARFQNVFDFGYARQKISAEVMSDLARGQFHIAHLPRNLHALLFGAPRWYEPENHPDWHLPLPNDKGMSLVLTTPALLYVFRLRPRRRRGDAASPIQSSEIQSPQNAAASPTQSLCDQPIQSAPPPRVFVSSAWLAIAITLVPLLLYYNTGWRQFGYRFSLDFILPLMILLAAAVGMKTTRCLRTLILFGVFVNAWGVIWWYTNWLD